MLFDMKIIVTGAATGIGKAIVLRCLQERAHVIACDLNEKALKELEYEAQAEDHLLTYQVDVSNCSEVAKFFAFVKEKHPNTNALVNNAGIYLGKNLLEYSEEDIDKVINVNVKGYIFFSQNFGALVLSKQQQGVIINMSSVSGLEGSSDAVYGLSKAAIIGLTKSCAMNFAPYVRVNAVAPTLVNTAMMDIIPQWRKNQYNKHELIPEQLHPEDVADTVVFLLSRKSRHYTGATLDINNGCYLR